MVMPKRLGPAIVFEDDYVFDRKVVVPELEKYLEKVDAPAPELAMIRMEGLDITTREVDDTPHKLPIFEDFTNWTLERARGILTSWRCDFKDVEVSRSWVNRTRKGGWINYHIHHHTDLIVVAYITAPPDCGDLLLVDPLECHWFGMSLTGDNNSLYTGYKFPVKNNKVYFFAPFIRHATEPSSSDDVRWCIALNLKIVK
jgi:uncharacterized protein (TIGR02466 family)